MAQAGDRHLELAEASDAGSPNQLTIEQLAQETGLSVRNLRSHHARGLLPPPEVRVRVGYYGPEHLDRLRVIKELQDEGLKLEGIKRLLEEPPPTGEGLLRMKKAADAAADVEEPEVVSGSELAQRLDLDEAQAAKALAKAEKLSLLLPVGDGLYEVPTPSLLEAAEEAHRMGIHVLHALDAIADVERASESLSKRFVKLFMQDVWKPFAEAGMPEERWPAVAEAMQRTRPLAAHAMLGMFRQVMSREVETTFAEIAKRLSEGKR
jgi:DNA-binding transcriptional MerR regulator